MFNNQLTAGPDGFLRDCGVELFPLRSRKFSSALLQVPVCITKLQHPNTRFVARSSRKWSKVANHFIILVNFYLLCHQTLASLKHIPYLCHRENPPRLVLQNARTRAGRFFS